MSGPRRKPFDEKEPGSKPECLLRSQVTVNFQAAAIAAQQTYEAAVWTAATGRLLPVIGTSRPVIAYRTDGQLRPAPASLPAPTVSVKQREAVVLEKNLFRAGV